MERISLRAKGQVTIPTAIRDAAHLEEGDPIDVELTDEGILLRPRKVIDPAQAWFWTPEWQEGERQATEDIKAGRVHRFESGEAFLEELRRMMKKDPTPASKAGHKGTRRTSKAS